MHGVKRQKTTAEAIAAEREANRKKIEEYRALVLSVLTMKKQQIYSEDALALTGKVLEVNCDFNTMWNYRKEIIETLAETRDSAGKTTLFNGELAITVKTVRMNPKSYWIWHHRVWATSNHPAPDWVKELELVSLFLEKDARNFHCWDYRRYVTAQAGITAKQELVYTTTKIKQNFSNYSAWHQRSKLYPQVYDATELQKVIDEELVLVQNACFTLPSDQSAWLYHRWLLGSDRENQRAVVAHLIPRPGPDNLNLLILAFSTAVLKVGMLVDVSCSITGEWLSADAAQQASTVWFVTVRMQPDTGLTVNVRDLGLWGDEDAAISFPVGSTTGSVIRTTIVGREPQTSSDVPPLRKEIVEQELRRVEELLQIEPDCRLALLVKARLLDTLGRDLAVISPLFNELKEIDSARRHFYEDSLSRISLRRCAVRAAGVTDLSRCGITYLCDLNLFANVTSLNLAHNMLRSMAGIERLVALTEVNLDHNQIRRIEPLLALRFLETVSLQNNCVEEESVFIVLDGCARLHLDVTGNSTSKQAVDKYGTRLVC